MIQKLVEQGVLEGVFPSAQAFVILDGKQALVAEAGPIDRRTQFDLASITKPVACTSLFMRLWSKGQLSLERPIQSICGMAPTAITFADLLYHRSGLPAFVPYFAQVLTEEPHLLKKDCPESIRRRVRDTVVSKAFATKPRQSATETEYSDVGFIWLGEALAGASSSPLDVLFHEAIAAPLKVEIGFHRISAGKNYSNSAPTGRLRPREPAPGQEGLWPLLEQHPSPPGEVDDDNAWVLDGVAGHSGLFSTARDLAFFGQRILEELDGANRIAPASFWQQAIRVDASTPSSTRALGYDTPALARPSTASSAGKYIARSEAIGHLGFTGTSLWIDLKRKLVVALCTNRSLLGRQNEKIKDFRPRFHDAVVEELGLT